MILVVTDLRNYLTYTKLCRECIRVRTRGCDPLIFCNPKLQIFTEFLELFNFFCVRRFYFK